MQPETFRQLLDRLTPEVYQSLKTAVEIGKWPNGAALSAQQRSLSLQAIIAYEAKHVPPEQRSGYMPPKPTGACAAPDDAPLKWQDD